jgi:hypothetical protein
MQHRIDEIKEKYNYDKPFPALAEQAAINILYTLDSYQKSVDIYTDNMIYSINNRMAAYLLSQLSHDVVTDKQAKSVLYLSRLLYNHGMGAVWSDKPVIINLDTLYLDDGLTRLCAVAEFSQYGGVMLPIKIIRGE